MGNTSYVYNIEKFVYERKNEVFAFLYTYLFEIANFSLKCIHRNEISIQYNEISKFELYIRSHAVSSMCE